MNRKDNLQPFFSSLFSFLLRREDCPRQGALTQGFLSWGLGNVSGKAVGQHTMQQTKRVPSWANHANSILPKNSYAGVHLVADFWNGKIIEDEKELKELLEGATRASVSEPLEVCIQKFEPQGITGVVLLAESHIALHTWPEINYTAIDIFTCGDKARPKKALEYFKERLKPKSVEVSEMRRGKK